MVHAWLGSTSSRRSQKPSNPAAPEDPQVGHSDVFSASRSTVEPVQSHSTSTSDGHINDPSVTPSLIHSTEKDAGTLRTSDAPPGLGAAYQRDSAPVAKQALFTPQDAILAQVLGKPAQPAEPVAHATPPHSSAPQPSVEVASDVLSMQTPPPSDARARPGPVLTIYEPFSGAKLGERTPVSPSTATPGGLSTPVPPPTSDDGKLWSSLERILGLQAEIAAMHAEMEDVGGRGLGNVLAGAGVGEGEGAHVGPQKRSRRGQTLPIGDEEPEEQEQEGLAPGRAVSEISTDHSDGGEDEDEGDGLPGYGKRRRDEEFTQLAKQFAQRKTAIGRIMNKLDDLSTALKTFHTLPAPLFDLATVPSRSGTMTSSSPPTVHVSPGWLSDPFSSPQTAKLVTPPGSRTPPVPPVSTLAPPASSGAPSASSGLGIIVPPVLPRAVLPTIITEAPHVESPADMHAPRPVFQAAER